MVYNVCCFKKYCQTTILLKKYYSHVKIQFATTTQQRKLTMVITNNVECNSSE